MTRAVALFLLAAATTSLPAYDFVAKNGLRWADGNIRMNLQLDDTMSPQLLSDGKTSWNAVAQEALDIWNAQLSRVQFEGFSSSDVGPGDGNNHNEVFFSSKVYGHEFGSRVLAITTAWRIGTERIEGDTVFNTEIDWDSYRGMLDFGLIDLRRVAAHEFGHTLGLDHPDQAGQIVVSVMNSVISDLDTIALDDIRGARALYPPPNTKFTLNINVIPEGNGDVFASPAPDVEGKYPAGTLVTLSAKPHRRFRFNFWGGDEILAAKKLRVLVVDNETITANFSTNGAPVITSQPHDQKASEFDTVIFIARVSSQSPVTYQWQHDGVDIPDNDAALVLHLVGHEDSGLYSVRVTNARGETFSKPARLVVDGY